MEILDLRRKQWITFRQFYPVSSGPNSNGHHLQQGHPMRCLSCINHDSRTLTDNHMYLSPYFEQAQKSQRHPNNEVLTNCLPPQYVTLS